jgi:hypothetical protein
LGVSGMTELERTLGQFVLYRFLVGQAEPDRVLFLAVPRDAYAELFDIAQGRDLMAAQLIKLIAFDPEREMIVEWIE